MQMQAARKCIHRFDAKSAELNRTHEATSRKGLIDKSEHEGAKGDGAGRVIP